jgi:hypothetical protein
LLSIRHHKAFLDPKSDPATKSLNPPSELAAEEKKIREW